MPINAKQELLNSCDMYAHLLTLDLDAVPENQAVATNGGCTRSAVAVVAECAAFNNLVAGIIGSKDTGVGTFEDVQAASQGATSREQAKGSLVSSVTNLKDVVSALSDDELGETIQAPWGQPMSRFGLANVAAGHMWYHNGQVAYIQSLNGDSDMHWMPEEN